jgi:hypothetical protein
LTSSTITEFRSRPRSANPDAPEKEIYSDREWKLVTYTLLMKRPTGDKEEILWRDSINYPEADHKQYSVVGSLAVNDTFLSGDRAYILYSMQGFVSVVNSTRNSDGQWIWSAPSQLVRSTDVYPVVKWTFTTNAKAQIAIDMIVNDKVRTYIWNLKGERWVQAKEIALPSSILTFNSTLLLRRAPMGRILK